MNYRKSKQTYALERRISTTVTCPKRVAINTRYDKIERFVKIKFFDLVN